MTWSERFTKHLQNEGLTALQVAHQLKVAPSVVHYWCKGATPRKKTQDRIERWSGGKVPHVYAGPARSPSKPPAAA